MSAVFREMPPDWTRDHWLFWRRDGVGASDVAAICGLSTFGSPMAVYLDKVGLAPEQPETDSMRWGKLLEPVVAAEFAEQTGLYVVCPQLLVHDEDQWWRRATLDGLVVEYDAGTMDGIVASALGLIEIKTTRDSSWDDGIPDRVALQIQYQLGVAQMEHAWLAVLHGGQRLAIHELDFQPDVFAALCSLVDRFYSEHVIPRNPPPADSNPATTAALKGAFGDRADGSSVVLDDETLQVAAEWLPAKAALKEAEAHVELIENRLRAALGDAVEACDECGPILSWKPQPLRGRIDEKRLAADHPEIAAAYRKPDSTVRVLRAAKALKEVLA